MRVFISFSHDEDRTLAARLEQALRRQNIEAWSSLDLRSGEDWRQAVDEASAKADGYVFLLGAGASSNPQLLTEWRNILRNDWEAKKPLIPIITSKELLVHALPPFLRNRQVLSTANFDELVNRLVYLLQHPAETRDHHLDEESRQERIHRLEELKEFALALKNNGDYPDSEAKHR